MIFNLMKPVPTTESATIPEGGTYYVGVTSTTLGDYTGATATYKAGDPFPEIVLEGDVYAYGDFEYRYRKYFALGLAGNISSAEWYERYSSNEWGCRVLDATKETYDGILTSICGLPVDELGGCFAYCENLLEAPTVPSAVVSIEELFFGCTSLTDVSNFVIPEGVTSVTHLFTRSSVADLSNFVIPDRITDLDYLCTSCKFLTSAPKIHGFVTSLNETFKGCVALTSVGKIPAKVNSMIATFKGCAALEGDIEVEANPRFYVNCFADTVAPIVLTGGSSTETKANLAGTANNGNVTY